MATPRFRRRWCAAALALAVTFGLTMLAPSAGLGQTHSAASPSPTADANPANTATAAVPASGGAPSLDSDTAVRMLLPAAIRDSTRLPVRKWARADAPNAPGGYVVF